MQNVNNTPTIKYENPKWDLIAAQPLSEALLDDSMAIDLSSGPLFQTMRDLGVPLECLNRIRGAITETAKGVRGNLHQNESILTVPISLFCYRMPGEALPQPEKQKNDAWGYYVIEKCDELPGAIHGQCHRSVELYLYKEGN